mmetsp:Transcript_12787/g.36146  ORF Transcript_12787/g.36146 Transcript_12787/m.36146 type:complete len:1154 (+) Transcript_12787:2-3463(+)
MITRGTSVGSLDERSEAAKMDAGKAGSEPLERLDYSLFGAESAPPPEVRRRRRAYEIFPIHMLTALMSTTDVGEADSGLTFHFSSSGNMPSHVAASPWSCCVTYPEARMGRPESSCCYVPHCNRLFSFVTLRMASLVVYHLFQLFSSATLIDSLRALDQVVGGMLSLGDPGEEPASLLAVDSVSSMGWASLADYQLSHYSRLTLPCWTDMLCERKLVTLVMNNFRGRCTLASGESPIDFGDTAMSMTSGTRKVLQELQVTQQWRLGYISNFDYLLYINQLSGRQCSDYNSYPFLPWVLVDFDEPYLNLSSSSIYRDLSSHLSHLCRRSDQSGHYSSLMSVTAEAAPEFRHLCSPLHDFAQYTFVSSNIAVAEQLLRVRQFTHDFRNLQANECRFRHLSDERERLVIPVPGYSAPPLVVSSSFVRLAHSDQQSASALPAPPPRSRPSKRISYRDISPLLSLEILWNGNLRDPHEAKELCPELFVSPGCLIGSMSRGDCGDGDDEDGLDLSAEDRRLTQNAFTHPWAFDVQLPRWAVSPYDFIEKHRAALESPQVSGALHWWIDVMFGCAMAPDQYHPFVGETMREQIVENIRLGGNEVMEIFMWERKYHGQINRRIFKEPHPARRSEASRSVHFWDDLPQVIEVPLKTLSLGEDTMENMKSGITKVMSSVWGQPETVPVGERAGGEDASAHASVERTFAHGPVVFMTGLCMNQLLVFYGDGGFAIHTLGSREISQKIIESYNGLLMRTRAATAILRSQTTERPRRISTEQELKRASILRGQIVRFAPSVRPDAASLFSKITLSPVRSAVYPEAGRKSREFLEFQHRCFCNADAKPMQVLITAWDRYSAFLWNAKHNEVTFTFVTQAPIACAAVGDTFRVVALGLESGSISLWRGTGMPDHLLNRTDGTTRPDCFQGPLFERCELQGFSPGSPITCLFVEEEAHFVLAINTLGECFVLSLPAGVLLFRTKLRGGGVSHVALNTMGMLSYFSKTNNTVYITHLRGYALRKYPCFRGGTPPEFAIDYVTTITFRSDLVLTSMILTDRYYGHVLSANSKVQFTKKPSVFGETVQPRPYTGLSMLVAGTSTGDILVFRCATGKHILTASIQDDERGITGAVLAMTLSGENRDFLLAGYQDGRVRALYLKPVLSPPIVSL